jgi:hypothetical protein
MEKTGGLPISLGVGNLEKGFERNPNRRIEGVGKEKGIFMRRMEKGFLHLHL